MPSVWPTCLVAVVLSAILYAVTMARDLGAIDSGELAAVCAKLGIAHPPGYPLYTLVGRAFVSLANKLGGSSPILAVNAFSAVAAAVAVGVCVRLLFQLCEKTFEPVTAGPRRRGLPPMAQAWRGIYWLPLAGALVFGTSRILWEQANGNEVYAFHALLVVWALERLHAATTTARGTLRRWAGLGYVLGLGAAHHLTLAFLGPAVLWGAVTAGPSGSHRHAPAPQDTPRNLGLAEPRRIGTRLLALVVAAVIAATAILYLPIRSAAQPLLDWGDPERIHELSRHVFAAQYRVWFFESPELWRSNLLGYLKSLPHRFLAPLLLLAIPGCVLLWQRQRRFAVSTGLVFIVTLVGASMYDIHDLEPYYLPADLIVSTWAFVGLAGLLAWGTDRVERVQQTAGSSASVLRLVVITLPPLLLLAQIGWNGRAVDRRDDRFMRFHVQAIFEQLPEGTVLLSGFWDAVVSPSIYLQAVEGQRPDVTVVDPELLRRSWYMPQIDRWDPHLLDPARSVLARFLVDLNRFEHDQPYDPMAIETNYRELIATIALAHRPERPTAVTPEVDTRFAGQAPPVPEGLVRVLRDDPASSPVLEPPDVEGLVRAGYRPGDRIHRTIVQQWQTMMLDRVRFLEHFGRQAEADQWRVALDRLNSIG